MRQIIALSCVIAVLPGPAAAQAKDGLRLSGTSRLRYEVIADQPRAGFNRDDELINLRTTLAASYQRGDWRLLGEVYDSRAWLADDRTPLSTGEVNTLELVQALVAHEWREIAGAGSRMNVQAGRMLLNLGSRRVIAADDYRNTTNSYTGIRADLTTKRGLDATLIYTLPQARRPDDPDGLRRQAVRVDRESFNLVLWGGLVAQARAIGPLALETSFFHLGERDAPGRPTRDRSLDTVGVRLVRDPAAARLDGEVEIFVQGGRASASAAPGAVTQPVGASFMHGEVGYTWPGGWQPRLSLEYDRASGDRAGGRYGRFDTLFGMRRAELAPSGLYNAVGRANLSSPALRLEVTPDKRWDGFVSARPLWLAARTDSFSTTGVRDASGRAGSHAGEQIDGRVRFWAVPNRLRLEVDAVLLRKGRFLRDAPNAPPGGLTRYLSLNATGSF